MTNDLTIRKTADTSVAVAEPGVSKNIPLGTADWSGFPRGTNGSFNEGDFYLSHTLDGGPLGYRDDQHVLIVAGPRSGKGASILLPNLFTYPGSVFVNDPKGENAIVAARRRGGGSQWAEGMRQTVRIFDPYGEVRTRWDDFADLKATFNPMAQLRADRSEFVSEAGRIAGAFVVSEAAREPMWDDGGKSVLKFLMLHVATSDDYRPEDRNLVTVRRVLREGEQALHRLAVLQNGKKAPSPLGVLFRRMKQNSAFGGIVAEAGAMFEQTLADTPKIMVSYLEVARSNTDFIDTPEMRSFLSGPGIDLGELKSDPRGVSMFVCMPQRQMEQDFRLLRVMTTLVLNEMERVPERPRSGHPVMMILDEFAALKRMTSVENAAAQIAAHDVKMVFVVQSLAQLKETYRDNWETFVAACGIKLFFGNDDHFTREYVSKLVGETEVVRTARNWSNSKGTSSSVSRTESWGTNQVVSLGSSWGQSYGGSAGQSRGSSFGVSTTTSSGFTSSSTSGTGETIHKRFLINPDEVGRLFGRRDEPYALALISGRQPLALKRTWYFNEQRFEGLFDPHPKHALPPTLEVLSDIQMQRARARWAREDEQERQRELAVQRKLAADRDKAERLRLAHIEMARQARQVMAQYRLNMTVLVVIVCAVVGLIGWQLLQLLR